MLVILTNYVYRVIISSLIVGLPANSLVKYRHK